MGKLAVIGLVSAIMSTAAFAAEPPVCDSADHCVWIMENHAPHEFDYDVLTRELIGFGEDGKDSLIMLAGDKDRVVAGRALDILTRGQFGFTDDHANQLIAQWPGSNIKKYSDLMAKMGTAKVQTRMIEAQFYDDPKVRSAARNVLARMRVMGKVFRPNSFEYGPLAKAVAESAGPELVQLLTTFPPQKTIPFLKLALVSDDAPSVIAAYEALLAINQDMAFESLLIALQNLTDDQAAAAFSLGALIWHRHAARQDGFYLKFAKELAEDPDMSLMGRVAGLHAIAGGDYGEGKSPVRLATEQPVLTALRAALKAHGEMPQNYGRNFGDIAETEPEVWAKIIWEHLKTLSLPSRRPYRDYFHTLGQLPSEQTGYILHDVLARKENIYALQYALRAIMENPDRSYLLAIEALRNHWSDDIGNLVRPTTRSIIEKTAPFEKTVDVEGVTYNLIAQSRGRCHLENEPTRNFVSQLPFFELEEAEPISSIKRRFIRSAYPMKNGWLVGFDQGDRGGDILFYSNDSGEGESLSEVLSKQLERDSRFWNVVEILPIRRPPLGEYADSFWVLVENNTNRSEAGLFRLIQTQSGFAGQFHSQLPRSGFKMSHLPDDQYLLTHDRHSFIVLSPDGTLKKACE